VDKKTNRTTTNNTQKTGDKQEIERKKKTVGDNVGD